MLDPTLISVLMPAHCKYGEEDKLVESVRSILNQKWSNWELILFDDASPTLLSNILKIAGIVDNRIRVIRTDVQYGISRALIEGMKIVEGSYVARQDADDLATPDRLQEQLNRFRCDPGLVLLGSWYWVRSFQSNLTLYRPPDIDGKLKHQLLFKNPFCHSSVMFTKEAYQSAGGYNGDYDTSQDLDLWFRLSELGKIGIVEKALTIRNIHEGALSTGLKAKRQVYNGLRIRFAYAKKPHPMHKKIVIILAALVGASYQYINNVLITGIQKEKNRV